MIKYEVKYAEAQAKLDPEAKEPFFRALGKKIKTRLPNGMHLRHIKKVRWINKAARSHESRAYFRYSILNAVLGDRLTKVLFANLKRTAIEYSRDMTKDKILYRVGYLYHFADEDTLESIRTQGLLPDLAGRKHVFLTDDPESMSWFPVWKTGQLKKDSVICLLKIDAESVAKKHELYYYRTCEIITDRIEPEDIIWD